MVAIFSQPVARPAERVILLAHLLDIVNIVNNIIFIIIIFFLIISINIIVIIAIALKTWSSLSSWLFAVSCCLQV